MIKLSLLLAVLVFMTGAAGCCVKPRCEVAVQLPEKLLGETADLHFEPHGLYGHINGGSELFLEFGFVGLDVHHVPAEEIDVEIYVMTDPAAALGIYLAKCGREKPLPGLSARNTGSNYQITAVAGSLFLQVNNFSAVEANLPLMVDLANEVLAPHLDSQPLPIWQYLAQTNRLPGTEFLFRGQYALDPIFTFGEGDILQIKNQALGAGARYDDGDGEVYRRLTVVYENATTAADAFTYLRANLDSYIQVIQSSDKEFVFKDFAGKFGLVQQVANRLDMAIKLAAEPETLE